MDHKTATYTPRTTLHWHRLFLCAGLLAALGLEECTLGLVSIQSPVDGTTFTEAQIVTITATALEGEGLVVEEVRFFHDDARAPASTDRSAPYTHAWPITDDDNGTHRFHAEADYRRSDGTTELLQSEEVVYEVAIGPPSDGARIIGSVSGVGLVLDVAMDAASGLAVVASDQGLVFVDLRMPTRPMIVGRLDLEHFELGVALSGTHAYVIEGAPGGAVTLVTVDLTDPSRPTQSARIEIPGHYTGGGISVDTSLAYVAASTEGLHILDIGNPSSPRIIGSVATSEGAASVAISGSTAFVRGKWGSLEIVDVRDPRNPILEWSGGMSAKALSVEGTTLAYIGTGVCTVVDASDPLRLTLLGRGTLLPTDVVVARARVFLGTAAGIKVLDPTRKSGAELELLQEIAIRGSVQSLAVDGSLMIAGDDSGTLTVISIE